MLNNILLNYHGFFALPLHRTIKHQLKLNISNSSRWNIVLGFKQNYSKLDSDFMLWFSQSLLSETEFYLRLQLKFHFWHKPELTCNVRLSHTLQLNNRTSQCIHI